MYIPRPGPIPLATWARQAGVAYVTAYAMYREDRLPVPAHRLGNRIYVDSPPKASGRTVIYASRDADDEALKNAGVQGCGDGGATEIEIVQERRAHQRLRALLADRTVATLILAPDVSMGRPMFNLLAAALAGAGRQLARLPG